MWSKNSAALPTDKFPVWIYAAKLAKAESDRSPLEKQIQQGASYEHIG